MIIDEAGRIAIPKPLRDDLRLEPGDALEWQVSGEQITLRPVRSGGALAQEHGVWVLRTGQPLAPEVTDAVLRESRDHRDPFVRDDRE